MPSVETLRIWNTLEAVNSPSMKSFPNVKTLLLMDDLRIEDIDRFNFINFQCISTNWPNLKYLGWHIVALDRMEVLYYLDSTVTGLPVNVCKDLSEKFWNEHHLPSASADAYRSESSIINLKGKNGNIHQTTRSSFQFIFQNWKNSTCAFSSLKT